MRFIPVAAYLSIFLFCLSSSSYALDDISLGPLLEFEKNEEEDTTSTDLLGPLVSRRETPTTSEFVFRPLFYWLSDTSEQYKEFAFLYPFSTYRRGPDSTRFQALIYLLTYNTHSTRSGFREKEFILFPLLFAKRAERAEDSYFALFPLFGNIKDKFTKDEIDFALFPLFLRTEKDEEVNTHVLWPFFARYEGGGQRGFKFWPLFGYRTRERDDLEEKFALWPLFSSRRRTFYDEERSSLSLLPFYSRVSSKDREVSTFLWPLFNHTVNRERGYERWDVPWPLFAVTRGRAPEDTTKEQTRFFPLYSQSRDRRDSRGFILWPLYRYSETFYESYKRREDKVLLFLYSDTRDEPLVEGGRRGRIIHFWPLFTYERDRGGNSSFHLLSLLGPFLHGNEGVERAYSSFWRIYSWKEYRDGTEEASFLWNLYKRRSSELGTVVDSQLIIPLFSYKNYDREKGFSLLGGLLGYHEAGSAKTVRFLYIPFRFGSEDDGAKISGGGEQ